MNSTPEIGILQRTGQTRQRIDRTLLNMVEAGRIINVKWTKMNKNELKELILKKAENGRISCEDAGSIAETTGTPKNEVGKLIDELKIKIVACQLGCF